MSGRLPLRAVFSGVAPLVVGAVLLSACATGGQGGVPGQSPGAAPGARSSEGVASAAARPVVAASPASATVPSGRVSPRGAHSSAASSSGGSSTGAAVTPPVPGSGTGATDGSSGTVYGVSDPAALGDSAAVQVQQLQAIRALGVTSVRVDASWQVGQPNGPGSFDFTSLDQVVASLRTVGLSADLIIDQTPSWAAVPGSQGSSWAQPASASAFAAWAGAVAARYAGSGIVRCFEIWNEPNIATFWQPKPDPVAYTADLKAAYAAIKRVDTSAFVISGGLAPAVTTATSYDPRSFLEDMYKDGAKGSFEAVGDHPYCYPASPDEFESWSGWSQMSATAPSLRSIMVSNGDSALKIWITEFGAPTSGPNTVGTVGQGDQLVQAISQVKKLKWIGSIYIYTWADLSGLSSQENGFGLLATGGAPKPAYAAVSAALAAP
jgi:hypothetical protein